MFKIKDAIVMQSRPDRTWPELSVGQYMHALSLAPLHCRTVYVQHNCMLNPWTTICMHIKHERPAVHDLTASSYVSNDCNLLYMSDSLL